MNGKEIDNMNFEEKKNHYKSEIDKICRESYNGEQKQLAKYIIDNSNENNIEALYTFITQRIKLGFTFDSAPEVNHNCISLVKYNEKLSFGNVLSNNKHKLIIGENYDALKNLLATYNKNGKGLIDIIYIDPPYNTESTKKDGNDYKTEVEASKFCYRDKFTRTGWLNMMQERLIMARKLLSDKGVIFISIDDTEQAYLKVLCDEIFGEENFVANFIWQKRKTQANLTKYIASRHEYILMYSKNINLLEINKVKLREEYIEKMYKNPDNDPRGLWMTKPLASPDNGINKEFYLDLRNGRKIKAKWRVTQQTYDEWLEDNLIVIPNNGEGMPRAKVFLNDNEGQIPNTLLIDLATTEEGSKEIEKLFGTNAIFSYPKPVELIKYILKISSNSSSIILDFFAGSGTTGQAVMELNEEDGGNRKCILVTNNENNIGSGICYERLYRVINGKGTKGESFDWKYKDEKPYLTNNSWDVFYIKSSKLKIDDYEESKRLLKEAEKQFKILNENYEYKDFDIYNQLSSLKPYKKEK